MNARILRALAEKDLREVRKNRIAIYGAIVLTVIFSIAFPLIFTQVPLITGTEGAPDLEEVIPLIPLEIQGVIENLEPQQIPVVLFLGYLFAPLFLIIPLMIASIIAAEAFVGEKERKTLEPLLYTPATDLELFVGKVLAALIPAVVFAWANFAVYTFVVNLAGWPVMHRIWFPTAVWWPMILWVAPAIALMGIAVTVLISSKVRTFMEAYQASGALVLIVVALLMGQIFGLIFLSPFVSLLVGAVLFALDALLIKIGVGIFSRDELMTSI
ncbi:MAG: ABC transporter permease subunit [Methanomicrobiales archaeon]|nr:ABC transporter permease subunit [Methanomicrobiales archaeon]